MRRSFLVKTIFCISLLFLFMFMVAPVTWLFITTISPERELSTPHLFPTKPSFENYARLLLSKGGKETAIYMSAVKSSVIVSFSTTILALCIGLPAAYAFARLKFSGNAKLLTALSMCMMIPGISLLIPIYNLFFNVLGLYDSYASIIFAHTTFTLPFSILIMRGYFASIPRDLEEAARVDGCTRVSSLIRIILPLSLPGITATSIFIFLASWDEFLFVLTLTYTNDALSTLPVMLANFIGRYTSEWGLICTGGFVASIIPVLLALVLQRYIIRGLTAGALKG
jgi:multiple sugar transport system permease protein